MSSVCNNFCLYTTYNYYYYYCHLLLLFVDVRKEMHFFTCVCGELEKTKIETNQVCFVASPPNMKNRPAHFNTMEESIFRFRGVQTQNK